jgi:hypothetical protein
MKATSKPKRRISVKIGIYFGVAIIMIVAILVNFMRSKDDLTPETASIVRSTIDTYYKNTYPGRHDVWWLPTAPPPSKEAFQLLNARKEQIATIIKIGGKISSRTKAISDRFSSVGIGLMVNGEPNQINQNNSNEADRTHRIDVCIVPKDGPKTKGLDMPLWNPYRELLMLPAIEWPEPLLKSILFHELGHASRHNSLDGTTNYLANSIEYAAEEVAMHELGSEILDSESNGQFKKRIRVIIARAGWFGSMNDVLHGLNSDDLAYFDSMFGCSTAEIPSYQLSSQCLLSLCFVYCDDNRLGIDGKIRIYKWFGKQISSVPLD